MYNLIKRYVEKMTKEDVKNFALSKEIHLCDEELDFVYIFIKKNWEQVIKSPNMLNLDRYKDHFNPDNFIKIKKLFNEYSSRFKGLI